MAEAESAIKGLIETQVANLASTTSVWALLAPQDAVRPFVTFEVIDESPTNVMGTETTPTDCLFEIRIYAESFSSVVTITNDMRTAFNRYSGTINSVVVQDVFYEGRSEFFSEQERDYERVLNFRLFYEE